MSSDVAPVMVLGFILLVRAFAIFLFYQSVVAGSMILVVAIVLVLLGGRRQASTEESPPPQARARGQASLAAR